MELLLFVITAGLIGFFIGRARRSKPTTPPNEQVVDVAAKEPEAGEKKAA
jgi:hypothetical protein